jgi:hypothetical protein
MMDEKDDFDDHIFSYTVPSDYLFDKSPEITLSSPWEFAIQNLQKLESVRKCVRRVPSMSWMPHLRRASCRQRDGHIWRILGMQRLCEMINYSLRYYSKFIWEFRVLGQKIDFLKLVLRDVSEHPCVHLARNDTLYMQLWNQKFRRNKRIGGTVDANLLRFAGRRCVYCSSKFDLYTSRFIFRERFEWDDSLCENDEVARKAPWLYSSPRLAALAKKRERCDSCLDYLLSPCGRHGSVECLC